MALTVAATASAQVASAAQPVAKFKVLAASGSETLSFQEQGVDDRGDACNGTTEWTASWRSTRPTKIYVFLKRVKGKQSAVLSADLDPEKFDLVGLKGEGTVSLSSNYPQSVGCQSEPESCPAATGPAEPFLTGTSDPGGSVNGGVSDIRLPPGAGAACSTFIPFPRNDEVRFDIRASAFVIPRSELVGKKKRLSGSATATEQVGDSGSQATASGTFTEQLSVTLKRLKLKTKK